MAIGALLTGIGALSQAVGHGMAAFGGDDKLILKKDFDINWIVILSLIFIIFIFLSVLIGLFE